MKLSRSNDDLQPEYDVVVIGSGYGGSIAASRFSRAGFRVCLLEKGKEFQPGDYPSTPAAFTGEIQINTPVHTAKENGLYDFHVNDDITIFKGCGLGGTSLVNANVSIIPEDRVFQDMRWPVALRNDLPSLMEGYALARHVLAPAPYPANTAGYPELAKSTAMKKSAEAMGQPFRYADINVSFADGPNSLGFEQKKCTNCGDCISGCNYAAKNTLIMNYLPDAVNHGAEIFCDINVSHVARSGEKWLVYFDIYASGRTPFHAPFLFISAGTVVIAGGTLGSTEILLRSREAGLGLSSTLGQHFTGNGDALGFSYNSEDPVSGVGLGARIHDPHLAPVGPCITSIIDMRQQEELKDGMTFEEGTVPSTLAGIINNTMPAIAALTGHDTDGNLIDKTRKKERELISHIKGPYYGATNHMQTFLIMSHDDGKGQISLKNGRLRVDWQGIGLQPVFQKASEAMFAATKALKGVYVKDMVWNQLFGHKLITVHPLGGCCMGDDGATGVTDHTGNVFAGDTAAIHPGLYVLDGAVIPMPLGTNPSFTIAAVSERACKLIAAGLQRTIDYRVPPVALPALKTAPGIQFTESLKGFFGDGSSPFSLILTNRVSSDRSGRLLGTAVAPALSERPLMVINGSVSPPSLSKMSYAMQLHSDDGRVFYFEGSKEVLSNKLWDSTAILYFRIFPGHDHNGLLIGTGSLQVNDADLELQLGTIKAVNYSSQSEELEALKMFSASFDQDLAAPYFKKFF